MIEKIQEIFYKWYQFSIEVTERNRYFIKNDFLEELNDVLSELEDEITINTIFYRARLYNIDQGKKYENKMIGKLGFDKNEMGAPPNYRTANGRANPEGISYLYLASDLNTSISEVRPWVGAEVCVAECKVKEKLKIINFLKKIEENARINAYAFVLNYFFSAPVDPMNKIDYIPTQVISEFIKQKGFEGIQYESSLGTGFNLVMFSKDKIEITEVIRKYEIKSVSYEYEQKPIRGENIQNKMLIEALKKVSQYKLE